MMQTLRYDWLPQRARWRHLARSGLPAVSRNKNFPGSHTINLLLTELVWSIWLDTELFLSFGELMDLDSISVHLHLHLVTNIQPSWPHAWLISQFIIWLAPRAGKMNQIARCDWLPRDFPPCPARKISPKAK